MWTEEMLSERSWPAASLASQPPAAPQKNPPLLGEQRLGNAVNLINLNAARARLSSLIYLCKNTASCEISRKLTISAPLAVTFHYKSKSDQRLGRTVFRSNLW